MHLSDPGKPTQNAHVGCPNGRLRFPNLFAVRETATTCRTECKELRPALHPWLLDAERGCGPVPNHPTLRKIRGMTSQPTLSLGLLPASEWLLRQQTKITARGVRKSLGHFQSLTERIPRGCADSGLCFLSRIEA